MDRRTSPDAATNAFDAIAVLVGVPDWDYPGQLVRDVEALVKERDQLKKRVAELEKRGEG